LGTPIRGAVGVAVGLLLVHGREDWNFWVWVGHLGNGLVVASFVAMFWHIPDMSEFFARQAREIMLDRKYLAQMSCSSLLELRSEIADIVVRKEVKTDAHESSRRRIFAGCHLADGS
jgi:hypothetical protein